MIVARGCFCRVRQQRRGQPDRAKQIGGDDGLGVGQIGLLRQQILRAHDAGVVDEHIQRGKLARPPGGKGANRGGVFNVQRERLHAGVGGRGLVERLLAPAGDDDLIAEFVEFFRKAAANAGAAAGDEDGVAG